MKALLPLALILALVACGPGEVTFDHDYVIPSGTGARLDAGEPVEILPFILEARVGETLRIVNRDFRGHRIGPYYVGSGETVTHTFTAPAEMRGPCTVRFDEEMIVRVTD
ncbi:MAG: hypothetical protein J5I28_04670 [Acidimicrobiales bacterium]|nr:hypothetical protein [Acidimicrobiales bacterium]